MSENPIPQPEQKPKHTFNIPTEQVRKVLKDLAWIFRRDNPNASPEEVKKQVLKQAQDVLDIHKEDRNAVVDEEGNLMPSDARINSIQQSYETRRLIDEVDLDEVRAKIKSKIENGEIQTFKVKYGGQTVKQIVNEMKEQGVIVPTEVEGMLRYYIMNRYHLNYEYTSDDTEDVDNFKSNKESNLINLSHSDLGLPPNATIEDVEERRQKLGYLRCPVEAVAELTAKFNPEAHEIWRIAEFGNPKLALVIQTLEGKVSVQDWGRFAMTGHYIYSIPEKK